MRMSGCCLIDLILLPLWIILLPFRLFFGLLRVIFMPRRRYRRNRWMRRRWM